jgi:hypothetical protein
MKRLIYCSKATYAISAGELIALLKQSRDRNGATGVGGMLLYCNQSFLQVLEGDPVAVTAIYSSVTRDPRHSHLRLLVDAEVPVRLFAEWTMGFEHVDEEDLAKHLKGFTPDTQYPLVNPDLITNAGVAQTLLLLYAKNAAS